MKVRAYVTVLWDGKAYYQGDEFEMTDKVARRYAERRWVKIIRGDSKPQDSIEEMPGLDISANKK